MGGFTTQEALRSRGLKDDTTCLVVDIIPYDHPILPPTPRKKQSLLTSFLFGRRSQNARSNKLSAVGVVEELFEEGSAMLAERCFFFCFSDFGVIVGISTTRDMPYLIPACGLHWVGWPVCFILEKEKLLVMEQ